MRHGIGASADGIVALLQYKFPGKVLRQMVNVVVDPGVYMAGFGVSGDPLCGKAFQLYRVIKRSAEHCGKFLKQFHINFLPLVDGSTLPADCVKPMNESR